MYIFNWKFGGLDFEVPEYVSRDYDTKGLREAVRKIEKSYGKDRLTIPAQDLAGGSQHSFEAVKEMEDIAFIEDGKKILYIGKSDVPSFDYIGVTREGCKSPSTYLHYGHRKLRNISRDADIFQCGEWEKSRKYVELKHSDNLVDENCFVIDKHGRTGFLVTTEMQRGTHNRGCYEVFDIGKDGGMVKHDVADVIVDWQMLMDDFIYDIKPEVAFMGGSFALKNFLIHQKTETVERIFGIPTVTKGTLLYDWESGSFKERDKNKIEYRTGMVSLL